MNIGNNLVRLREAKGLKQHELANMINVSDKTISSYENNRSLPNIEILVLIANALDTNIDTIIGLNKENVYDLSNAYEHKKYKETIIKFIILAILFLLPIFYFYYATSVSLGYFIALIHENLSADIVTQANKTIDVFNNFIIIYVIYLLFILVNYILYKKKKHILTLVINGIILICFTIYLVFYGIPENLEIIVFPIISLFLILCSFKSFKKNYMKK